MICFCNVSRLKSGLELKVIIRNNVLQQINEKLERGYFFDFGCSPEKASVPILTYGGLSPELQSLAFPPLGFPVTMRRRPVTAQRAGGRVWIFRSYTSLYQHSHSCTEPVSILTDMSIITEFREVGVEGHTMIA